MVSAEYPGQAAQIDPLDHIGIESGDVQHPADVEVQIASLCQWPPQRVEAVLQAGDIAGLGAPMLADQQLPTGLQHPARLAHGGTGV